ncbi:uncharacterized protein LOC108245864 isoform X2 [Kryptolebias marmoratus]|uniref:uncharacterized protein LOC108245864 isoform X2 n=1 Tax=Kryptolebias marmoratus TaxID=37003 RepID=UPI000D53110A|nr:uncharacterized protein LOC108245864 isoform X2 [Kryptolebias marmoratus]
MATSAAESDLRIVILGKNQDEKTKLTNLMTGRKDDAFLKTTSSFDCVCGEWGENPFTLIKTGDVLSQSMENVQRDMKMLGTYCPPGPNVLLLLVNPSDFTEADRHKVRSDALHRRKDELWR